MKTVIVLVITTVFAVAPLYGEDSTQPPPTPAQEQPEVLTRGPVHEAFAEPVDLNTQTGVVAPTQPPANIVENPPADKPVGDQYVWIPGYWAWDSERNDYIWVSGCWRAAPPGRYWVPGYWSQTGMGWEWVPGFWAQQVSNVQQIEYLPAPPVIADVEPQGLPPNDDNIWVPPCWYWYQGQYVWRNGYWLTAQEGWIWTPSHYVYTPRGYVFAAGYWDYPLRSRGVLFAPFYIPRHAWERPGFSLSLGVTLDIGALQLNMFTCPRYCHYYFGDYYDDFYIGIGIFPRFECESRHSWYDPIYEHNRWSHLRSDPRWEEHERNDYELRRANKDMRPPRTYNEMEQRMAKLPEAKQKDIRMARTMDKVIADKKTTMKFEPMKADTRQKISTGATDLRKFGEERSKWESSPAPAKSGGPNIERNGPATTQPTGQRTGPASDNKAGNVSVQETKHSKSEQVNIPSPPIVGKQEGIFKTSPSQPDNERKTDVKHTPSSNDSPRGRDTSEHSASPRDDSSRDKGSQRDDHR